MRQNSLIILPNWVVEVVLYSDIIWSMSNVFSSMKTLSLRSSTGPTIQYPVPFLSPHLSDM